MAVAVLWKIYIINPLMYLPPELVAIILQSVVAPSKSLMSHNHNYSDDQSELVSQDNAGPASENADAEDQHIEDDQHEEPESNREHDDDGDQDEFDHHDSRLLCVIS
jgi:hypothetical protein